MARCQNPQSIRDTSVTRGRRDVPCGKCENCLKTRIAHMSFRVMQEDKVAETSYFLTLTYGLDSVPLTKRKFMALRKRDLQLFFKRLRKANKGSRNTGKPIKYFAVGEYGGKYHRPHYHILLFNVSLESLINSRLARYAERGIIELDGSVPMDCPIWGYARKVIKVPTLKYIRSKNEYKVVFRKSVIPATTFGHATIGTISGASVGYTMKYVSKTSKIPMHKNDDRPPEFCLMSKGLGINYLTEKMQTWHRADLFNRQYVVLEDGKKLSMPRYYKIKMLDVHEKSMLKAWNELESMNPKKFERCARERGESLLAGIRRHNKKLLQNQKL